MITDPEFCPCPEPPKERGEKQKEKIGWLERVAINMPLLRSSIASPNFYFLLSALGP
jgi:hypothetical protein